MKKLTAIGELLIDFIPENTGSITRVRSFIPRVGGAPGNVLGAFVKLGGQGTMLSQVGEDPFGKKITVELNDAGIDMSYVSTTSEANTSLAFVTLDDDGNREFAFYRNPGADMLMKPDQIKDEVFHNTYALHFCSVSLGDYPMGDAHRTAVRRAQDAGCLISFDPNLRLNLWKDHDLLKKRIWEFIPEADILKISEEEVKFITGYDLIEEALPKLFTGCVQCVIYTSGSQGASAYTKTTSAHADGIRVKALDTTGAGDGFIGSFLYQAARDGITDFSSISARQLKEYLTFANAFCALGVQKQGAIDSYPSLEKTKAFMHETK